MGAGGVALGYGLDDQGFESRQGLGIFLFTIASRPALGSTQPPIQWLPAALSLGVKLPGREARHSPPSKCRGQRMHGTKPPLPQYVFVAWCSVKSTGTTLPFTFTCLDIRICAFPFSGRRNGVLCRVFQIKIGIININMNDRKYQENVRNF
jgi:hypothetical protein